MSFPNARSLVLDVHVANCFQRKALTSEDSIAILNLAIEPGAASPARRNVTVSGSRSRGLFNSIAFNKLLPWESSFESALLTQLEFSCIPALVHAQPARLRLVGPSGRLIYTPDLLFIDHARCIHLVESKERAEFELLKQRFDEIELALDTCGIRFHRVTEDHLFHEHRMRNAATLMPYRTRAFVRTDRAAQILIKLIQGVDTFGELSLQVGRDAAFRALANRLVHFDFSSPLTDATPLILNSRSNYDATPYLFA